jgi:CheY-like chemotaxis protein
MDGLTTIRIIRENESKVIGKRDGSLDMPFAPGRSDSPPVRLPVIALTGNARPAQGKQALEAGMDDGE